MKLVVGGAQFGAPYGIANATGTPSPETVCRILCLARDAGVDWIDTARAYPGSEEAIGTALEAAGPWSVKLATKLLPLRVTHEGSRGDVAALKGLVRASLTESRHSLKRHRLDAVLLHRWEDFRLEGGLVADIMHSELEAGGIAAFGVSVQSPKEFLEALSEDLVRHIQLPFNILDHRWERALPEVLRVKKQRPLTIHARSALLQGLLLSNNPDHWRRAHVPDTEAVRSWLVSEVREGRRRNVQDLCLAWVRAQDWIDGVVVGAETMDQMSENLKNCQAGPLEERDLDRIRAARPCLRTDTLDPSTWLRD